MNFGIIGAGEIGRLRAEALRSVEDLRLAAVADLDAQRCRAAAGGDAQPFRDHEELLSSAEVDAVVVAVPPDRHEAIAVAALEAGKHVLCEKPLAPTPGAARRIVEVARKRSLTVATGFNQRYFAAIQFVKQMVEGGAIGELSYVRAFAGHTGMAEFREPWEYRASVVGGGALMDNGIHLIDHVQFLMGPVRQVYGHASQCIWRLEGSEDNGVAVLHGDNGRFATLHASWSEWRGYRFWIEAYGDRGMARAYYAPMFAMAVSLDQTGGKARRKFHFYPSLTLREKLKGWQSTVFEAFQQELRDFAALTRGEQRTIAEGFEGFRAVEIAHAVYESTRTHAAVTLADPF